MNNALESREATLTDFRVGENFLESRWYEFLQHLQHRHGLVRGSDGLDDQASNGLGLPVKIRCLCHIVALVLQSRR